MNTSKNHKTNGMFRHKGHPVFLAAKVAVRARVAQGGLTARCLRKNHPRSAAVFFRAKPCRTVRRDGCTMQQEKRQAPCRVEPDKKQKDMERIDYKTMLDIARWQHNHHPSEGLTSGLFTETFGKDLGQHFHGKWTAYFNGNLWDMLAYFRGESANGQKFCDMLQQQVSLYKRNRQRPAFAGYEASDKDITDTQKPQNNGTL